MLQYDLQQWLDFIDRLDINHIELGLERVSKVYQHCIRLRQQANKPCQPPTIVTIAGTNGKGSTAAVLEQILLNDTQSVAVYTSPHLIEFNERIRINGANVNTDALCNSFAEVEQCRASIDIKLTYFEYTTLAAFMVMLDAQLDVWVLEVGLGGRLDAVNCLDADIGIITSISLDHTQFLGNTLASIAFEKAGISRQGKPLICGTDLPELLTTLEQDYAIQPLVWQRDFKYDVDTANLVPSNVGCALKAAYLLGVDIDYSKQQWSSIINHLNLSCRLQHVEYDGIKLLLDVAHNQASAETLSRHLTSLNVEHVSVAFGMMADKDILSVVDALYSQVNQWILCDISQQQRAATAKQVYSLLKPKYPDINVKFASDVHAAIALHRLQLVPEKNTTLIRSNKPALTNDSILVVTGSFYTTGAAYRWLKNQQTAS